LLHGFPTGEGVDFKDKDEIKMYFIKVKKFLRGEFVRLFGEKWKESAHKEDATETPLTPGIDDSDDLPF